MRQDRIDNIVAVMGAIARLRTARAEQIMEATLLTASTVNLILGYLSDNGYVALSTKDVSGRRRMHNSLTEKGIHYIETIKGMMTPPEPSHIKFEKDSRVICGDFGRRA